MDDYAADVFALMDALKLDDAVIGGLSMGGYVAFAMLRLAPARFTGLVLADTRSQADTPQAREGRVQLRELLADGRPARRRRRRCCRSCSSTARAARTVDASATRAMIESARRRRSTRRSAR